MTEELKIIQKLLICFFYVRGPLFSNLMLILDIFYNFIKFEVKLLYNTT